jgi:methyl coenzyme M reductase gamma subunit
MKQERRLVLKTDYSTRRKVAKWVLGCYDLQPTISTDDTINCNGYYLPDEDTVVLNPKLSAYDFIETTIHEAKHVMDAYKYGIDKFRTRYNQASVVAVNCGNDPYLDNKWEIRANNFADREMKKKWRDLYNDYSKSC